MTKITYTEKFNQFWQGYPNDLCHGKSGSKFTALKAWEKYSEEEQDRIIFDMKALIQFDRKDPRPDRWPHASTFLNQRYFDRQVGSVSDLQAKAEAEQCGREGCRRPVHGPRFTLCTECYAMKHDRWLNERKERFTTLNILAENESVPLSDLANRCRQYLSAAAKSGRISMIPLKRLSEI